MHSGWLSDSNPLLALVGGFGFWAKPGAAGLEGFGYTAGCYNLLGYRPQELSYPAFNLAHLAHSEEQSQMAALLRNGGMALLRLRNHQGDFCWCRVSVQVSPTQVWGVVQEAGLNASHLSKLAVPERNPESRTAFLARMSHELRTPLNSIIGFAHLLQSANLPSPPSDWVTRILSAGEHLLEVINQVLDMARLESGKMTVILEPSNLLALVREVMQMLGPQAEAMQVQMQGPPNQTVWVLADTPRLRQVLINLLSNAIKFNRRGGKVWVELQSHPPVVSVAVVDTGLGIKPHLLPRLFTPFERLDAPELGVAGDGLGLAISKALVEAMGGNLRVESWVGEGSRFVFTLPQCPQP